MDKIYNYMLKLSRLINKLELKLNSISKDLNDYKTDSKNNISKELNMLSKSIPDMKEIEKKIADMKPNTEEDKMMFMYKILDKMKLYTIKNGTWHYGDKDTGIKAEAKDGKDGIDGTNGKDGVNGKDGKNGRDGISGRDGVDGKNGLNGKDGVNGLNSREIELSTHETYISWRYKGDKTWNKLVNVNDLIGARGLDGISSYQQWLNLGNTGTQQEFIDSLQGVNGVVVYEQLEDYETFINRRDVLHNLVDGIEYYWGE